MLIASLPKSTAHNPPPALAKSAPYEAVELSRVPHPLLSLTPESQSLSSSPKKPLEKREKGEG